VTRPIAGLPSAFFTKALKQALFSWLVGLDLYLEGLLLTEWHLDSVSTQRAQGFFPRPYEPELEEPWVTIRVTRYEPFKQQKNLKPAAALFTFPYDMDPTDLFRLLQSFVGPCKVTAGWRTSDESMTKPPNPLLTCDDYISALSHFHFVKSSPTRWKPIFLDIVITVRSCLADLMWVKD